MTAPQTTDASQTAAPRRFPTRTCVACRAERQKREFIRIVRGPDGTVAVDTTGRANGRGAYLCADASCWSSALKKKSIERALSVTLPAEVRAHLEGGVTHGA
ncbi:MAG TPA: YlxR family protein [Candidatus Limnocylindrales bacterium]|nr:YlxR family protein [Candidatus Limnocylindrales bacterium]